MPGGLRDLRYLTATEMRSRTNQVAGVVLND